MGTKLNYLLPLAAWPAAALLASCERENVVRVETTLPAWPPVEMALKAQINAMNGEDLPAFMSYLHPDNVAFKSAESTTRQLFNDYELRTVLEKTEAVSLTEGEAKVKFTQLTQKLSGPEFRDNRVTGLHTLRKDHGVWKIFATEADGVVYLDAAS